MIVLYDNRSGAEIGRIDRAQLDFLISYLEEESAADQDYYINQATVDLLASKGGDAHLIELLRAALGEREDMEIRWTESANG